jgi:hypothetical protein
VVNLLKEEQKGIQSAASTAWFAILLNLLQIQQVTFEGIEPGRDRPQVIGSDRPSHSDKEVKESQGQPKVQIS